MTINTKKDLIPIRQRSYLNKDRDGFLADLLSYAKVYYPDKIKDFSSPSLGGLFLETPAGIGDVMSFYLDHQFLELFHESAVETTNIESHIRSAGVPIVGASPAVVKTTYYVEVPAIKVGTSYKPQPESVPIILQGTVAAANSARFELTEDLDFSMLDNAGNFVADIVIGSTNSDGSPASFIMSMEGTSISGFTRTETFVIPNQFVPFRRINLAGSDITEIISCYDSDSNFYYEVESLTHDTVFKATPNRRDDSDVVDMLLEMSPAPYRFVRQMSLSSRTTTLIFGGGQADSLDNDIIPDPSEFAIPLYGKTTFSNFSIDPNNLLNTRTLGVSPQNTTLTIQYRYGGGLSHNVAQNTIRTITKLLMVFPGQPNAILASQVRASTDVRNEDMARGGENAPTIDELKSRIPSSRNSQSRVVSGEDLLARVYTMPSNFGRVYRAAVRANQNNPLSSQLFIISRDADGNLSTSPDSLKENLIKYLTRYRMISDAVDILDARVINLGVDFEIVVEPTANKNLVIQNVISKLQKFLDTKNFQIDQPIKLSDLQNIIFNTIGVVSVINIKVKNLTGAVKGRSYSPHSYDIKTHTYKGLVFPAPGSLFEVKYKNFDIVGSAI